MIGDYKQLQIWQKSIELVVLVYDLTKKFPDEEKFGIVSQVRRAAVSIPSNIAEGKLRGSDADFKRFLFISFGSGGELETQIEIAIRLGFITEEDAKQTKVLLLEIMKMLNSLILTLKANC